MKKRALCPLSGVHLTIKPKNNQILATLVLDICHARFRYLSVVSQISVSCELDIITNNNLCGLI